jgi:DNA-binding NarL/FixJ family response regulator
MQSDVTLLLRLEDMVRSGLVAIDRALPKRSEWRVQAHPEELVRQLIQEVVARPMRSQPQEKDQVVLDLTVEGFRCLLVRPKLPSPAQPQAALSPREQEIVRLAAMGHPNKIIAYTLNISIWTVSTHLRHIFAKLNVCSRAAMVAKVLGSEYLDPEYQRSCSA